MRISAYSSLLPTCMTQCAEYVSDVTGARDCRVLRCRKHVTHPKVVRLLLDGHPHAAKPRAPLGARHVAQALELARHRGAPRRDGFGDGGGLTHPAVLVRLRLLARARCLGARLGQVVNVDLAAVVRQTNMPQLRERKRQAPRRDALAPAHTSRGGALSSRDAATADECTSRAAPVTSAPGPASGRPGCPGATFRLHAAVCSACADHDASNGASRCGRCAAPAAKPRHESSGAAADGLGGVAGSALVAESSGSAFGTASCRCHEAPSSAAGGERKRCRKRLLISTVAMRDATRTRGRPGRPAGVPAL